MPFLSCFPEGHHLSDVFKAFPETVPPLLDYHDILLRGPSPLTIAERELIAAYVSGTNACSFCFGAHSVAAESFGIDEQVMDDLLNDFDKAVVDEKMRPLLAYVGKLTREPARITKADADEVLAAGWSERALFDAVSVCALFNFMNRIVEGMGVKANANMLAERRDKLRETSEGERKAKGGAFEGSPDYVNFGRAIGVVD